MAVFNNKHSYLLESSLTQTQQPASEHLELLNLLADIGSEVIGSSNVTSKDSNVLVTIPPKKMPLNQKPIR